MTLGHAFADYGEKSSQLPVFLLQQSVNLILSKCLAICIFSLCSNQVCYSVSIYGFLLFLPRFVLSILQKLLKAFFLAQIHLKFFLPDIKLSLTNISVRKLAGGG